MGKQMHNAHEIYPTVREINPIRVANLMIDQGAAACAERWHWLCEHAISDLATEGRMLIKAGRKWPGPRQRRPRGPRPGRQKTNR